MSTSSWVRHPIEHRLVALGPLPGRSVSLFPPPMSCVRAEPRLCMEAKGNHNRGPQLTKQQPSLVSAAALITHSVVCPGGKARMALAVQDIHKCNVREKPLPFRFADTGSPRLRDRALHPSHYADRCTDHTVRFVADPEVTVQGSRGITAQVIRTKSLPRSQHARPIAGRRCSSGVLIAIPPRTGVALDGIQGVGPAARITGEEHDRLAKRITSDGLRHVSGVALSEDRTGSAAVEHRRTGLPQPAPTRMLGRVPEPATPSDEFCFVHDKMIAVRVSISTRANDVRAVRQGPLRPRTMYDRGRQRSRQSKIVNPK